MDIQVLEISPTEEPCSAPKKIKFDHDQNNTTSAMTPIKNEDIIENRSDDKGATSSHSLEDKMQQSDIQNPNLTENEGNECINTSQEKLPDPLNYTREKEFTSEIFKVQIHNLPKFGFSDLKKRLKSHLNLNPNKIKSPDRQSVVYVCFRSAEERDTALAKINGHVWKGHTLEAKVAAPVADPYLQKRLQAKNKDVHASNSGGEEGSQMTPEQAEEKLKANVCPLWNIEYSQQLQQKTDKVKGVLRRVALDNFVKPMFRNIKTVHDGMPCELLPIVPSPETTQYRNKNEFTIGYGLDGKTVEIGFRYGLYRDGTTAVGNCENLGIVMPAALPVVNSFKEYVSSSRWHPFQQQTGTGHWQTLTVRTFRTGDVMVMVDFVPRQLEQTDIEEAKASIKEFYSSGPGSSINIKSFYFRILSAKGKSNSTDVQLLFGEQHVYETLMGLNFRISPEAFFQVNTPATEKLYDIIIQWCQASPASTILDICCGTGTIGLAIAKKVKEVIGIEMCAQAIEDAKANASINGITNVTYYCSKVEDVIQNILYSIDSSHSSTKDIVAVVDPPRAGLHKDVIRTLRRSEGIQQLVYVSCNPEIAMTNFIDLIRPETSRHKGSPYTLVKAIPVDLFPGTRHCELVLLLTRRCSTSENEAKDSSEGVEKQNSESTEPGGDSIIPSNCATDTNDASKVNSVKSEES